jgi:AraC-like DNA-binding protein
VTAVPNPPHPARHLLRAKDCVDSRYSDPALTVEAMAEAAGLSRSHFTREFSNTFGETPRAYLLTRRLERAAYLLRNTDNTVADICFSVGLSSLGSFTSSFTRTYGKSPTAYRASFPDPRRLAVIPECVVRAYGRPARTPDRSARLEKTAEPPGNTVAVVK